MQTGIYDIGVQLKKQGVGAKSCKCCGDGDVKIAALLKKIWPSAKIFLCSGHLNKNLGIWIKDKAAKKRHKGISSSEVLQLCLVV